MDDQPRAREDALVLPGRLLAALHPRRGGLPGLPVEIDHSAVDAARRFAEHARDRIQEALDDPRSDPAMAGRARRHLADEPDPMGAAVVAELACRGRDDFWERSRCFAESWLAEHGLAFAVCAVTEQSEVSTYGGLGSMVDNDLLGPWGSPPEPSSARRLRGLLAAAGDREYAEAVERLDACVRTATQRLVAGYFAPTQVDWVDQSCAASPSSTLGWTLLASLSTSRQLDLLGDLTRLYTKDCDEGVLVTLADGLGPAAVPVLAAAWDGTPGSVVVTGNWRAIGVLGLLPWDGAFAAMCERIEDRSVQLLLLETMERFPDRAVRVLSPATAGTSKAAALATEMLKAHLRKHPELSTRDDVPAEARAIAAAVAPVPDAPEDAIPLALREPPWLTRPKKTSRKKPAQQDDGLPVVTGLEPPAGTTLAWAPDERERWRRAASTSRRSYDAWSIQEWREAAETFHSSPMRTGDQMAFLVEGPDEVVLPLLTDWRPDLGWLSDYDVETLVARHGEHALDIAYSAAKRFPKDKGGVLLPYLHADAARLTADWLVRLRSAEEHARAWLRRHAVTAVPYLVPDALGRRRAPRAGAQAALRFLAEAHGAPEIVQAARPYADAVAEAVEAILAGAAPTPASPPSAPAKKRAKPRSLPDWADPAALPQVRLRGRDRALPAAATRHLLEMLTLGAPGEPDPEMRGIRQACDPESLAEFAWALFTRWQMVGEPGEQAWVLTALGPVGDDTTVRRLAPRIRAWPAEHGHAKAVKGLDVLAAIGTEVALTHLHAISQRVRHTGLRTRAREKIDEIAGRLGLSPDELGDRLVPDLGLDAAGTLVLDYGPRRFTVGFDERLTPFVRDEDGTVRKALPRPGDDDDPELAPIAYKRFTDLKKDVRTAASAQLARLEAAMVAQRRWTSAQFRELFLGHPLVRHTARRLVWLCQDDRETIPFRVAEDLTLTDAADDPFELPDAARVTIAHPARLDQAEVTAWSELFADYEIVQPFPQLGRPVHTLDQGERATGRLERFEGVKVPSGAVLGLERRGWVRGPADEDDVHGRMLRSLPGRRQVVVELDPGLYTRDATAASEQLVTRVALESGAGSDGDIDAVQLSETLADLDRLTAGAPPR
ncbi:DUF4132 domain-containing protein [Spirillospora sp. CA-142024]|uniref:DUF4132 domain-containing protein n=1 Tax=Spirillospora sp. CA-142024 TaxID=3240036 RepID=UPI003D8DAEB3